jgi:hypothetical protein
MKFKENKSKLTLISLFLMISMIASSIFAISPIANAQTVIAQDFYSYAYVGSSVGDGGKVGVGQAMQLVCWTKEMPPDIGETNGYVASPNGRAGWYGWVINVTKPDGITESVKLPYSDPVGADYISYTPDQVGTYVILSIFPETVKNTVNSTGGITAIRHYSAAVSVPTTFVVTAEPQPLWNEAPLPDDYWTLPVNAMSRNWLPLIANRLGGASQVWPNGAAGGTVPNYAYSTGPTAPHILWSTPFSIGGLMDERTGSTSYQTTHYQGTSFSATIILDGKLYFSPRMTNEGNSGLQILDLFTGNTLYLNYSSPTYAMASIYDYSSPNQMGGFAYLWRTSGVTVPEVINVAQAVQTPGNMSVIQQGNPLTVNRTQNATVLGTVWEMDDGWTRQPIAYIANVSTTGTQLYTKDGSICYYNLVNKGTTASPNWYVTVWNSSAGTMPASQLGTGLWQWRPAGGNFGGASSYFGGLSYNNVHNGALFYSQNFSIPNVIAPINSYLNETGTIRAIRQDEYMIVGTRGWNTNAGLAKGYMWCISLANNASKGTLLWSSSYTPPYADVNKNVTGTQTFSGGLDLDGIYPEDNVITWHDVQTLQRWVYDLQTGELLWTSPLQSNWVYYNMGSIVVDHKLLCYGSYSGQFIAYDIRTGEKLWSYNATNIGNESPYGYYPMVPGAFAANNVLYTYGTEHHLIQPLQRGPMLRCINITDGSLLFAMDTHGSGMAIADGILIAASAYDNTVYAYGMGPTKTSVSAPQTSVTLGQSLMITGSVTDQTPSGRHDTNSPLEPLNTAGTPILKDTPAISDADMADWMAYKYMQQGKPANAKGVPVTIDTIDPNGNFIHIGDVTSDITGNFGLNFKPDIPGNYQIIANFHGSNSYYPSTSTTYLTVSEAGATPAPTAAPADLSAVQSAVLMYVAAAAIAIIIAIVIVGLLIIRKRA